RVRDRGLRVVAHPARAHLVRREEPLPARALRHPPAALDERLEVVAVAPGRQAGRQREDRLGPRGVVQARLRLHPVPEAPYVVLVLDRIPGDGLAVRVDLDAAVASVTGNRDERGPVLEVGHALLVVGGGRPRNRRGADGRRVLRALEQESVAGAVRVLELVRQLSMWRATPRAL